uniref:Uncharacterized protein n=2 Tax=Sphaerodactylus townsendi TaxID=933632 RepID=A0ACB8EUR2_9SAUR
MKLKDDFSSKRKVAPSLKKSHSTYDHMTDVKENNLPSRHDSFKEAPLLDSLMRKKLAKKASERSNSDSLDNSAPLVYKSASAHNLSAGKKALQVKPSPLQKSLSVATSAKEKALLLTSRAHLVDHGRQAQDKKKRAAGDSTTGSEASGLTESTDIASNLVMKQLQRDDASEATADTLLGDSSSVEDTACPEEAVSASITAPSTPSESRIQKHVTYAPNRSYSEHISDWVGKRYQAGKKTPPEPPIRQQSLSYSLERRDQTPALTRSLKRDSKGSPTLANVHSWETEASPARSEAERSRQAADDTPLPSPVGLQRLASIAAEVCPWEVMEVPSKKDPQGSEQESQSDSAEKPPPQVSIPKSSLKTLTLAIKALNRSRLKASARMRRDSEGSPRKNERKQSTDGKNEKPSLAETASLSVGGSPRQQETPPSLEASRAIIRQPSICPWEEEDIPSSPREKSPGKAFEIYPWEMSQDGTMLGRASSTEAMAPESMAKSCPVVVAKAESQEDFVWRGPESEQDTSKFALMVPRTDNKKAAAYPCEVPEATDSGKSDGWTWGISTALPREDSISKVDQKKPKSMDINKAQICPWETEEVSTSDKALVCPWDEEEPLMKISSVDKKEAPPRENSTTQCAEATQKISQVEPICPWESMELPAKMEDDKNATSCRKTEDGTNIKIVICPWEMTDQPGQDPGEESKRAERTKARSPIPEEAGVIQSRKWDRAGNHQDPVCPWDTIGDEEPNPETPATIPDLPKVILKTSSGEPGKKAAVCPWEAEDIEVDLKAAICPWEETLAPSDRTTSKRTGDLLATSPEMVSSPRNSICPWETMDTHEIPSEASAKGPDPSKVDSKESSRTDTFKGQVCPWESQETESRTKADVCPWEEPESSLGKTASTKGGRALEHDRTTPSKETVSFKATEKKSSPRESVCPWETVDPGETFIKPELSKAPSKKSESVESLRAEICPWEVPESPPNKRALTSSNQDGKGTTVKSTEKQSSLREEVCPWESMELEEPSTRSGRQSPASKKSDSLESLRAVICPWETVEEDLSTVEVPPGAVEKAPFEKKMSRHDPVGISKVSADRAWRSPGAQKTGGETAFKKIEKSKSHQETVYPWGSMDFEKPPAKSSRSLDLLSVEGIKAEICPWEFQEVATREDICPWETYEGPLERDTLKEVKSRSSIDEPNTGPGRLWKALEKGGSSRDSISPSSSIELLSSKSPNQSKTGSSKSDSSESLRAEVCPWEVEEEESDRNMPPLKAEPLLITKVVLKQDMSKASKDKRQTRPDLKNIEGPSASRKIEKAHSHQELAYKDTGELSIKQTSKSFDLSKVGSQKSDSSESLRAEICPWESQEFELVTQTETFPWEVADVPLERRLTRKVISSASQGDTEAVKKGPRDRPKVLASSRSADTLIKESDCPESSRIAICPWEAESPELFDKEEICPWETGNIMVSETKKQATCADRSEMPPVNERRPQSKLDSLPRHRPLCRTYPERTLAEGLSKDGDSQTTTTAETGSDSDMANICPWDDPASIRKDSATISKSSSEASLLEGRKSGSRGQTRKKPQTSEAKSSSQAKSVTRPWDSN